MARRTQSAELIGLIDPGGMMLGFLIPVFRAAGINMPLAQEIDGAGRIIDFVPLDDPDARLLPAETTGLSVGENGYWGFALGPGTIIHGNDEVAKQTLAELLADPALIARPTLAMEVSGFLNQAQSRDDFAARVFAKLSGASLKGAAGWRDLSVLTTDVRKILARNNERGERWPTEIVIELKGNVVTVLGLSFVDPERRARIRAAVEKAMASMPALFADVPEPWRLVVDTDKERAESDASIIVFGEFPRAFGERLCAPEGLALDPHFTEGGRKTTGISYDPELPLFALYTARADHVREEAIRFAHEQGAFGIALGALSRWTAADHRAMYADQPEFLIEIPASGVFDRWRASGSDAATVKLAVAIGIEAMQRESGLSSKLPLPNPHSALLRTVGSGDDPFGIATLYDRAWGLGLAPWNSLKIGVHDLWDACRNDIIGGVLLGDVPLYASSLIDKAMRPFRPSASLLISSSPADGDRDLGRHARCVANIFDAQRWDVRGRDIEQQVEFAVEGARTRLSVIAAPPGVRTRARWHWPGIRDRGLLGVDSLRVSCTASPGVVLAGLDETNTLIVNVRDIIRLPAERASIWNVVGAQLLRSVTSMSGRPRTMFLALVIDAAFRLNRVSGARAGRLYDAVRSDEVGEAFHLVLSSVKRVVEDEVVARGRTMRAGGWRGAVADEIPMLQFSLGVSSDGPWIEVD